MLVHEIQVAADALVFTREQDGIGYFLHAQVANVAQRATAGGTRGQLLPACRADDVTRLALEYRRKCVVEAHGTFEEIDEILVLIGTRCSIHRNGVTGAGGDGAGRCCRWEDTSGRHEVGGDHHRLTARAGIARWGCTWSNSRTESIVDSEGRRIAITVAFQHHLHQFFGSKTKTEYNKTIQTTRRRADRGERETLLYNGGGEGYSLFWWAFFCCYLSINNKITLVSKPFDDHRGQYGVGIIVGRHDGCSVIEELCCCCCCSHTRRGLVWHVVSIRSEIQGQNKQPRMQHQELLVAVDQSAFVALSDLYFDAPIVLASRWGTLRERKKEMLVVLSRSVEGQGDGPTPIIWSTSYKSFVDYRCFIWTRLGWYLFCVSDFGMREVHCWKQVRRSLLGEDNETKEFYWRTTQKLHARIAIPQK